ncbi:MAG: quinolinate synthase NadA, partial [Planctomycetes bacterium]|nr:quinolinate synthase NadA [Planctomycetota bacterium]
MAPLPISTRNTEHVDLVAAIAARKKELNAVILAHYYQVDEIQDVADFIGDSLQLAREAANTDADVIVFCGVHFMAETAKILSPEKIVLLPDLNAGCSLADSAPEKEFREFVENNPEHTVVTYVNSSAAVKALSDYCVTSSNAVDVVKHIGTDKKIIFAPDKFLGDWVIQETGRDLLLWDGACEIHEMFSEQAIRELQQENEGCITLVHPECPAPVRDLGDVIGSTKKLLQAVADGPANAQYIVVTEPGIIHKMKEAAPQATFIMAPAELLG